MSWGRRRRGFFFLIFVLLVVGLLAAGVAYFWPAPTCDDGWRNQNELDVDCGGVCEAVCAGEPKPLVAGWARVFSVDEGWFDVAGLLVNPNPQFGASRVPYRFRLVDADNLLVSLEEGETFLNPGESFIVFRPRAQVGRRVPVRAALELTGQPNWYRTSGQLSAEPVIVRQRDFSADPTPTLRAILENVGSRDLIDVRATALLSDAGGNALAASATVVDLLEAGSKREISFTWPRPLSKEPSILEVDVHVPAIETNDS